MGNVGNQLNLYGDNTQITHYGGILFLRWLKNFTKIATSGNGEHS